MAVIPKMPIMGMKAEDYYSLPLELQKKFIRESMESVAGECGKECSFAIDGIMEEAFSCRVKGSPYQRYCARKGEGWSCKCERDAEGNLKKELLNH